MAIRPQSGEDKSDLLRGNGKIAPEYEYLKYADPAAYQWKKLRDEGNIYADVNEKIWAEAARRGEKESLLSSIENRVAYDANEASKATVTGQITNDNKYLNKLKTYDDYIDYDAYRLAIDLPLYDNTDKSRQERYDAETDYYFGTFTDREWAEMILDSDIQRIEGTITEEKKKTQNFFVSVGTGIADLGVRLVAGVTEFISDIYNIEEGLVNILVDTTEKNIGTRFLKAFDNGDALENAADALYDVSYELERDFTHFVDASTGEVTTTGKYWRGITDAVGYMVPVIGWGKLATGGAKVYKAVKNGNRVVSGVIREGSNLSKLSGKIFYAGLASSNVKNSVEYANNNGISLSQLNAGQIIANATIKAVAQYAIEKLTGKLLGSSQLDKMIGMSTKSARAVATGEKITSEVVEKAGIANIIGKTEGSAAAKYLGVLGKDAIKEGIEETLQELSDGLFDTLFGKVMNEQTVAAMYNEHFSIETLVDSFVIGGLTSIVMGFGANMKYIRKSNRAIGVDETSKAYRMGAFQSMNFSRAMQMLNEWNDILNDRKSSQEDKMNAATRLSFLMSTVGDVMSNIGEKRAIKANALLMQNLDNMAREEKLSKMSNVTYAKNLCNEFFKGYKESSELYNEQIKDKIEKETKKLADELKISGTTKFDDIITVKKKADDLSSQEKTDELLKAIKASAIVATDGSIITKSGDIVFVNSDYLKEKSNIDIMQQLGYKEIEKAIVKALNKNQKQFAMRIYRVATGSDKVTIEEVVRAILFDKNFYAKLLLAAGESKKLSDETFSIFPILDKIIEKEANIQLSNKTISDDIHKTLLEKARANIRAGLINYATQCAFIDVDMKVKLDDISVQVLDADTKRIIREHPNYLLTNKFNTLSNKISLLESKNVDAAYTTKSASQNIREELSDLLNVEIYAKYANLLFSNGDEKGVDAINKLINSENIIDLRRALECLRLVAREAGLDNSANEKVLLLPMEATEMSYNETLQVFTEVFGNTISELRDGTYKVQNIPNETMADILTQSDNAYDAGDKFSFANYYDRLNYCRQYLYNISGGTLTFGSSFEVLKVLSAEEFFKDELFDYEKADEYKYKPNSIDDATRTLDTNIVRIVESKYNAKTNKVEKLYLRDFMKPEFANNKLGDIEIVFDINERNITNAQYKDGVITIYSYKNISSNILHEATHAVQQTANVVKHDNLYAFGGSPDVFGWFDTDVYDDLKADIFEDNPLLERAVNYTSIKYKTDTTNYIFYCLLRGENEAMATIDLALVQSGYTYVWKDVPVGLMINGKYKPFKESKVKEMRKTLQKRNVLEKSNENITLGEGDKEMVEKYEKDNARIRDRKAKARSRRFTKKRAEKSNLNYFYKKGIVNQLDDAAQDFVEATTAEFDKLHNELKTQIIDGTLTKQSLLDFAATKNNMNDYTFKMLAKHFFKNDALAELTYKDYKLLRDKYLLTAKTLYDFVNKKGRKLNKFKYHYSKHNFNKFERGDIGFHFGTVKQAKQRMKNLGEKDGYMYIIADEMKNPYVVEHDLMQWYAEDFALYLLYGYDTFFNSGKKKSELIADLDKLNDNNLSSEFKKYFEELKEIAKSDTTSQSNAIRTIGRKKLVNIMKELGYDGIRYKNEGEEEGYTDIYFDVDAFAKLPVAEFESKIDRFLAEFDENVDEQKHYEDLINNLNAGEKVIDAENLTVSSNTANTNYAQLPFFKLYDGSIRSLRDIYRYVSSVDKSVSTFGWEAKSIEEESLDDVVGEKSLLDLQRDIIGYYSYKYVKKYVKEAKDMTAIEGTYNKLLSTRAGQLLLGQMIYEYEEEIENGTFEASEFDSEGNVVGRTDAVVYERPWHALPPKEKNSYIPTTNWANLKDEVKHMLILQFAEMFGKSRFDKLVAGLDVNSQAYRDKLEEEYFRTQAATITRLPIEEIGKVRRVRERPNVIKKEKIYNVANRLVDRIISKDRYDTLSDFTKKIIVYKDGEFIIDMSVTNEFDGRLNEMYETMLEDEYMLKSTISTSERLRGDKERLLRTIKTQMKQIEQAKRSDNQKRIEQLEGYLKKNREKLEKLEKRISKYTERELNDRLKSAEKLKGFKEKVERERERANKEREKRRLEETKDKSFREKVAPDIETRVKGEKFKFDSNQEPNNLVRHIIGTMFEHTYIQNVQNRESNSEIEKMSAKDFYEHNGNELLAASIEDIETAAEWFMNTEISKTDDISPVEWARTVRHYEIVRGIFLSLVLDYSTKNNMWSQLDANLRKQIDLFYTTKTTLGSDFMNIQKESLRRNEPLTYMTANNLVFDGITIPDDLQNKLFDSISGNVMTKEKIKQMQDAQREIIDYIEACRSAKKSVLRRIASFRAVSMLSSPLTWLRNIVSNNMLKNLNRISEKIGNAMFKNKEYTVGQLSMSGNVKISFDKSTGKPIFKKGVTPEVQKYINENFFDNGLFQSIIENMSKFSPTDVDDFSKDRLTGKPTTEGVLGTLILKNLYNQYYNNGVFKTKSVQKFFDFVMKRMNDTPWVREATIKYFAKILAEKGYDLKNTTGITDEIANDFAIAISLGLKDYMHSDNIFNRLEKTLAEKEDTQGWWFAYKLFLPFASASWNWLKGAWKFTPMGLVRAIWNSVKLEKRITRIKANVDAGKSDYIPELTEYLTRRDLGAGIIGTMLMAFGAALAWIGMIRLEDDDYGVPKLKIGSIVVDVSSIFGSSSLLYGASIVAMINKNGNFDDVMNNVGGLIAEGFPIMSMLENDIKGSGVFTAGLDNLQDIVLSFIPNLLTFVAKGIQIGQPNYQGNYVEKFLQRATAKIPFLNLTLPRKIDIYTGKELYTSDNLTKTILEYNIWRLIPYFSLDLASENENKTAALGLNKSMLKGQYVINDKEIKVTGNLLNELNRNYGKWNAEDLTKFYSNGMKVKVKTATGYKELSYNQMTPEQVKRAVQTIMSNNAEIAKIKAWTAKGNKYYASKNLYKTLQSRGIKTNVYRGTNGFVEK